MLYRLGPDGPSTAAAIEQGLQSGRFVECGATQAQSGGWVAPRGEQHAALVEAVAGQWLLEYMSEKKVLPGAVVKRRVDELAKQVEAESGRKPGRKLQKELRDQALLELLPLAFTRQTRIPVWLDPAARLLFVGTATQGMADELVSALVKAAPGLQVALLQTAMSPAAAMSVWLAQREAPPGFSVDRECELKSEDEQRAVVRYARHTLDIDEVGQHIAAGKRPTRLALTWDERISFVLTEALQLKRLDFLDVVFEGGSSDKDRAEDGFDADAAITTGELRRMLPMLVDALGGEAVPGATPAA